MKLDFDGFPIEPISRYISKQRLRSLFEDGLYIPNLTQFEDRWEGLLGVKLRQRASSERGIRYSFEQKDYEDVFRWVHASCWYQGSEENFVMWRSYGQSEKDSVQIETTTSRLEQLYRQSDECYTAYLNEVRYFKPGEEPKHLQVPSLIAPWGMKRPFFGPDSPDLLDLLPELFSKYEHFSDEREVRLACVNKRHGDQTSDAGLLLDIKDPSFFIRRVRVSPFAGAQEHSEIQEIVSQYIPNLEVERSSIQIRT